MKYMDIYFCKVRSSQLNIYCFRPTNLVYIIPVNLRLTLLHICASHRFEIALFLMLPPSQDRIKFIDLAFESLRPSLTIILVLVLLLLA